MTPPARQIPDVSDLPAAVARAKAMFAAGDRVAAVDVFEAVLHAHPRNYVDALAELYDLYQTLPGGTDRYHKYQSRHADFRLRPGDRVLDIGSGHHPLPAATHLAEFAIDDDAHGRAGVPFVKVVGKPVIQCRIERMPFPDGAFEFVYCSHVMEHADDPEAACREVIRVGRRGYIESPTPAKDLWLDMARASNHRWGVELFDGRLVFSEYSPDDVDGLRCDILMKLAAAPKSNREKAFAALLFLKANRVNTMLLWEGKFDFEIRRRKK